MRTTQTLACFLLFALIISSELIEIGLASPTITYEKPDFMPLSDLRPLKVQMNTRTLQSDGAYMAADMANAARNSGYDAIFFADNLIEMQAPPLADPGFENVSSSGTFSDWSTITLGNLNTVAYAGPNPNASLQSYYFTRGQVLTGNHSLYLKIQSSSTNPLTDGYAIASTVFPKSFNFSQTSGYHPMLSSGLTFSTFVYVEALGKPQKPYIGDNGWFYLRFRIILPRGPYSQQALWITLVWSDQVVNGFLRASRESLNQTNSKVIYFNPPPWNRWIQLTANVTDLALQLYNQTVVDQWRIGSIEIGVRSRRNALVSAYVGYASLTASSGLNVLNYWRVLNATQLSNETFKAYPAYSVEPQPLLQPTMLVYNTSYVGPNQGYNLTDVAVWKAMSDAATSNSGVVVLGPLSPEITDYVAANQAFGERLIDATNFDGLKLARTLFKDGEDPVFVATAEAILPTDYNSSSTWCMRVFANSNSESDILDAISQGRAYLTTSNFTGSFSFDPYNFPITGTAPIYIPTGENVSLPIYFTGALQPGLVRIYQDSNLDQKIPHNGNASLNFSDFMRKTETHFYVAVTAGINDSLVIVSNPIKFQQASIIPNGALFVGNDQWTVQSSAWSSVANLQSFQVTLDGPEGTNATLYLYSPTFSPTAKDPTQLASSIDIQGQMFDPASMYNATTSTFSIPLTSTGQPVQVTFNFNFPFQLYLTSVFTSVVTLYLIAILPFAIAVLFIVIGRLPRRMRGARKGRENV